MFLDLEELDSAWIDKGKPASENTSPMAIQLALQDSNSFAFCDQDACPLHEFRAAPQTNATRCSAAKNVTGSDDDFISSEDITEAARCGSF
jgi:hypothetical protein